MLQNVFICGALLNLCDKTCLFYLALPFKCTQVQMQGQVCKMNPKLFLNLNPFYSLIISIYKQVDPFVLSKYAPKFLLHISPPLFHVGAAFPKLTSGPQLF